MFSQYKGTTNVKDYYSQLEFCPSPRGLNQAHQVRREKDKRLSKQIELLDPTFENKISLTLSENWNNNSSIEQLRTATESLLGGRRTKEWKLRSQLDL